MSTRSYIGIEDSNGSITFVYCHHDGYPSGVGAQVVGMGRGELRDFINEGDRSSVDLSYRAWRNERRPAKRIVGREGFLDELRSSGCNFAYVLSKTGTWMMATSGDVTFRSLKRELSGKR